MSEILNVTDPAADLVKSETLQPTDNARQEANGLAFEDNDPENPRNWPSLRKWLIIGSVSSMTFMGVFAPAAIVPAAPEVLRSFRVDSALYRTLLVTIWELGEGVSPFLIAPLSERYGRLPIFHAGTILSLGCAVASALSVNISMVIAFRFLSGLLLPAASIGPAIVGDLFKAEERGFVMSVTFGFIVLADFVSPIIGSYVAQALGWRWILWLDAIAFGVFGLISLPLLHETYAPKILARKATRITKENDFSISSVPGASYTTTVTKSFVRPLQILVESPIVLIVSLCVAVQYGVLSLIFATLTEVMESTYSISQGPVGFTFLSLAIGNLLATILFGLTSDRYLKYTKENKGDGFQPEARLVHLLLSVVMDPCGLILYGWTANFHLQYIVPLVGVAIQGACLTFSLLATETYLVDIYNDHGASAIAAGITLRTIFGTVFPLAGPALYKTTGLGWGNSILALIFSLLLLVLLLLMRNGERLRRKEKLV